jgi:hypothetical protein
LAYSIANEIDMGFNLIESVQESVDDEWDQVGQTLFPFDQHQTMSQSQSIHDCHTTRVQNYLTNNAPTSWMASNRALI